MKDGKCPKCNSATVYTKRNGMSIGDGGIRIYISSVFATTATSRNVHYICTTCGYFEIYIEDRDKLEAVTKDWKKVG